MANSKIALDWSRLLGFDQVTSPVAPTKIGTNAGEKLGALLGAKIGGKDGIKG